MAAHNYVNPESSGMSNRVVAFFSDRNDAYRALSQLKEAGFRSDEIGMAVGHDYDSTAAGSDYSSKSHDESFWQKVKDFFSGEDYDQQTEQTDFRTAGGSIGWTGDRYGYYDQGIAAGGAVVTVTGARIGEARRILESSGGDLRESGFDASRFAQRRGITDAEHRIQLRGELLRTYKERVSRGDVKLRKDVITEDKTVEVPVTREELVVERTPGSGKVTGDIGTDREIRVPLSEERVRVEKQPVVNEEVRVSKRQVQDTQKVSDKVRREELHVDKEGQIESEIPGQPKRKNPAA